MNSNYFIGGFKKQKVIDVSERLNVGVSWIHNRFKDFYNEIFDIFIHQGKDGKHMTLDDGLIKKN